MMRRTVILFCAALFALLAASGAPAMELSSAERAFLDRRTAVCYIGGMALDDIVIGASGKLTFIYVDRRLGAAIQDRGAPRDGTLPDVMSQHLMHYTSAYSSKKGRVLIAVAAESFKNWTLDTSQLRIGGYAPTAEDFTRGATGDRRYEITYGENLLAPGYSGMFSLFVPTDALKPGTEVEIGIGDDVVTWKVPTKNE